MAVLIVEDLVSGKWLTEVVSTEETSTQVEVAVTAALAGEGLLEAVQARHHDGLVDVTIDDETAPSCSPCPTFILSSVAQEPDQPQLVFRLDRSADSLPVDRCGWSGAHSRTRALLRTRLPGRFPARSDP